MFSTDSDPTKSKTKCAYVCGAKKNLPRPAPITLCGRELPWVTSATHLSHELHESGSMDYDAVVKRATYQTACGNQVNFTFCQPYRDCLCLEGILLFLLWVNVMGSEWWEG